MKIKREAEEIIGAISDELQLFSKRRTQIFRIISSQKRDGPENTSKN